jgi:hypothetical protein
MPLVNTPIEKGICEFSSPIRSAFARIASDLNMKSSTPATLAELGGF